MKILAVDTTTRFLCLGIYAHSRICEYVLELGRKQSALLVPTIKRVLEAADLAAGDIDYFACGLGPGSFTGMRVGLAAIKGFSWALHKPVLSISTLDILARNAQDNDAAYIMPAIDAKRGLIYCAIFKNKGGQIKRITPYLLLTEREFLRRARPGSAILGDAAGLYKEKFLKNIKGVTILEKDYWYPKARNIIGLALERLKGKKITDAFRLKPIYLYPKECQVRRHKAR
ncbi:MAG: tRNA (adenosine(37)-N6)-threonylcarbamoyltransferase complex dimerization subunit type 1 TsaB [Candidatus Omnitrophota bacterium]